mmetsp:Transcript_29882/g.65353  ORF Transcript_29882/g.65353 Transcript_29882/m.65353 type:complete len:180 (-) Transcript_29882:1316-1855(-)
MVTAGTSYASERSSKRPERGNCVKVVCNGAPVGETAHSSGTNEAGRQLLHPVSTAVTTGPSPGAKRRSGTSPLPPSLPPSPPLPLSLSLLLLLLLLRLLLLLLPLLSRFQMLRPARQGTERQLGSAPQSALAQTRRAAPEQTAPPHRQLVQSWGPREQAHAPTSAPTSMHGFSFRCQTP